jgi:hypothetical protein
MHECRYCGAKWQNGDVCPYCRQPDIEDKVQPTVPTVTSSYNKSKRGNAAAIAIICGAIVVFVISLPVFKIVHSFSNSTSSLNEYSYSSSSSSSKKDFSDESLKYQQEKGIYSGGIYKIGRDIPAGEYLLVYDKASPYGDFYFEICSDEDMSDSGKIYGDWQKVCAYVILDEGTYIKASNYTVYDISKNDITLSPFENSGMYKVGRDIEPGTYFLESNNEYTAQYSIYTSINSISNITRCSGFVEDDGTTEVTLKDGEYIKMTFCHLKK